MSNLLGMPENSGGIFLPGGSLANIMALSIARNKLFPNCKETGIDLSENPVILCSETVHYSIFNAANLLGLGTKNIVLLKTNNRNELLIEDLKNKIQSAKEKKQKIIAAVFVVGNTVTGGIDPIEKAGKICKDNNIRVHVDAAFGGGLALTSKFSLFSNGIKYVDSISWDTHKSLHSSLTSTVLILKNPKEFNESFNSNADYLFHHRENNNYPITEDLGHQTILCGKRFDALKTWLLWKSYGTIQLKEIAESRIKLTEEFYEYLKSSIIFEPSYEPISPIVCFKYKPLNNSIDKQTLNKIHLKVRNKIRSTGKAFFNIANLNGENQFRVILINPLTKLEDLKRLTKEIENEIKLM